MQVVTTGGSLSDRNNYWPFVGLHIMLKTIIEKMDFESEKKIMRS